MIRSIYLAGPDVFLPDATARFASIKSTARALGLEAWSPFDSEAKQDGQSGLELAREIYTANINLIKKCDAVLANCNVFRGALVDDGTSFEIGFASAMGKVIYGYIDRRIPLPQIVAQNIELRSHPSGYPQDAGGYLVNEDFGNSINLMLEFAIEESGGILVEGTEEDALKLMAKHTA